MKQLLIGIFLCLGTGFLQLAHAEEKAYEFQTLAKGSHGWDGESLSAYPSGTPEITIGKIVIAPNVRKGAGHEHRRRSCVQYRHAISP